MLSVSLPRTHSGLEKIPGHLGFEDPLGPCETGLSWNSTDHLASVSRLSDCLDHSDILGLLELVSVQSQGSVTPEKSACVLFPSIATMIRGHRSLWGKPGRKINTIEFWGCSRVLS